MKNISIGRYKMPVVMLIAITIAASAGFAAVLLTSVSVDVPVTEALSVTSSLSVSLTDVQPNENHLVAIDMDNVADAENKAQVTFVEDSNPDLVTYSVSYDTNPLLIAGLSSGTITATIHIESDSPVGTIAGHWDVERIAV